MPAAALPFQMSAITLRVCADLGWRVIVSCPGCRYQTMLNLKPLAGGKLGSLPLGELLEGEHLVCRRRCAGVLANGLTVSHLEVGRSHDLARWEVVNSSGSRRARMVERQAD